MCRQPHHVARPAHRYRGRAHRVFEHQVPADDPRQQFAHGGVGVGVGAAGDRNHGGELAVAHAGEGAADGGDDEREDHRGAGIVGGRVAVSAKSPAPMMAPMPSATRLTGPQRALELVFAALAFAHDTSQGFDWQKGSRFDSTFSSAPEKINRHPQQNKNEPANRKGGLVDQQQNFDHAGNQHVQGRQNGVAHGAVGPLHIGTRAAQPEETADRQDVEQQNCKDNIIEQIVVLPAERQQHRPDALDGERENGRVVRGIERAGAPEKQVVARHGEVDARAGQESCR